MGNIGDPIVSGSIPAVGTAGTTYASNLNLFLTEVKNRLEARMPKASLADGDLDMNGSAVENASELGLIDAAGAPTTPINTLQAFGGELYWISPDGPVQLTSGGDINVSNFNGITGDYGGANPAQFRFVDADQEYYAYDDFAGGAWARIWAKNFDIAAGATSSNRVRLAYGGGGSYVMTLPPAAPGSDQMLQMASSGAVTASNTLSTALTAQDYKFTTTQNMVLGPPLVREVGAGPNHTLGDYEFRFGNSTNAAVTHIPLRAGDRVVSILVYMRKSSDATNTLVARFEKCSTTGGTTLIASGTSAGASSNNPGNITFDFGVLAETLDSTSNYYVRVFQSDATPSAVDAIFGINVSFTRP